MTWRYHLATQKVMRGNGRNSIVRRKNLTKNQRKINTKVSKLFETKYILRNHDISE